MFVVHGGQHTHIPTKNELSVASSRLGKIPFGHYGSSSFVCSYVATTQQLGEVRLPRGAWKSAVSRRWLSTWRRQETSPRQLAKTTGPAVGLKAVVATSSSSSSSSSSSCNVVVVRISETQLSFSASSSPSSCFYISSSWFYLQTSGLDCNELGTGRDLSKTELLKYFNVIGNVNDVKSSLVSNGGKGQRLSCSKSMQREESLIDFLFGLHDYEELPDDGNLVSCVVTEFEASQIPLQLEGT
uniref:Uncharacterized protein n=1 Tax=Vespula pensylvanica TaxID=30213 RepID=A0A834U4F4_VESPE|nr:hypothetical protein H0235_011115 [Vespula pensylvanica]